MHGAYLHARDVGQPEPASAEFQIHRSESDVFEEDDGVSQPPGFLVAAVLKCPRRVLYTGTRVRRQNKTNTYLALYNHYSKQQRSVLHIQVPVCTKKL